MKAIDFFCGAGGVTCGFKKIGIHVLAGIDIDKTCEETYTRNNETLFINEDISKLPQEKLLKYIDIKVNDDDLIFIGCSPCQYYSNIKTDKTKSQHTRYLLDDFSDFTFHFKPGYIFIENVPGFKKDKNSPISRFKEKLEQHGYVYDDKVLNAKYYGVPQNRRRYVLIASRVESSISLPIEDKQNIETVKSSIGNYEKFKPIKAGHIDGSIFQHSAANLTDKNIKRLKLTPKNGGDRRVWQDNTELQLKCYQNHTGHYDVYGRMYWDKPSPTITTRFRSISNGRYGHPEQDRAISIREGAALQSFPLDYIFYSSNFDTIAKMIGNAVPPDFAASIGKALIKGRNII